MLLLLFKMVLALGAQGTACANTFSIIAYDPETKSFGIAVASKYLAVGSAVPWAKANSGAVATQSFVNVSLGYDGVEMMGKGKSAEETMKTLLDADPGKESRQVAMIDAKGEVAAFTGKKCMDWAGHKTGKHFSCQGNLLTGKDVVDKMHDAYENTKGPFAWRLMAALEAGDKAGGDKRGKQSAAILIVREKRGPNGFGDRELDLRVDDHETPIPELSRLVGMRVRKK